eukprot:6492431-Amphidinium_carterae.1
MKKTVRRCIELGLSAKKFGPSIGKLFVTGPVARPKQLARIRGIEFLLKRPQTFALSEAYRLLSVKFRQAFTSKRARKSGTTVPSFDRQHWAKKDRSAWPLQQTLASACRPRGGPQEDRRYSLADPLLHPCARACAFAVVVAGDGSEEDSRSCSRV